MTWLFIANETEEDMIVAYSTEAHTHEPVVVKDGKTYLDMNHPEYTFIIIGPTDEAWQRHEHDKVYCKAFLVEYDDERDAYLVLKQICSKVEAGERRTLRSLPDMVGIHVGYLHKDVVPPSEKEEAGDGGSRTGVEVAQEALDLAPNVEAKANAAEHFEFVRPKDISRKHKSAVASLVTKLAAATAIVSGPDVLSAADPQTSVQKKDKNATDETEDATTNEKTGEVDAIIKHAISANQESLESTLSNPEANHSTSTNQETDESTLANAQANVSTSANQETTESSQSTLVSQEATDGTSANQEASQISLENQKKYDLPATNEEASDVASDSQEYKTVHSANHD